MSFEPNYTYIEPQALADAITEYPDSEIRDFVIVDVRDFDFTEGGHIPGCVNVPSEDFEDVSVMSALYEQYQSKTTFIFHCYQSRIRGPTCANVFSEYIARSMPSDKRPHIRVLRGGFQQWSRLYEGDEAKIEK
jgi:rhodanese-related sulfurtransferase